MRRAAHLYECARCGADVFGIKMGVRQQNSNLFRQSVCQDAWKIVAVDHVIGQLSYGGLGWSAVWGPALAEEEPTLHTADHQGEMWLNVRVLPLPSSWETPYVLPVLLTVGSMVYPPPGVFKKTICGPLCGGLRSA